MLIVKYEADAPDSGREADVLGAGQVVQNNLGLGLGGHVVLRSLKLVQRVKRALGKLALE
jgi:hypothetical protein